MDNPNDLDKKDHMQSDIFHQDVDNRRDLKKVLIEKKREQDFVKEYVKFKVDENIPNAQTLKQKNLRSHLDMENDKHDYVKLTQGTENSKGWKEINDTTYGEDSKKADILLQNDMSDHKAKRQQHLRSCMDNTDYLANNLDEKKKEKKVIELELNFDDKTSVEDIKNQFKGLHVISSEFEQCTLTGKHFGKGKIKLRVDEQQEEIVNRRIEQTPNLKSKKIEEGNFNKKLDYTGLSGSKWFSNNLAQESKHHTYKDDFDGKQRMFKEFGESKIFGDSKQ